VNKVGNEWEGILVRYSPLVEVAIVLYWSIPPILLFNEEEATGIW
jgi:hypothetical protein